MVAYRLANLLRRLLGDGALQGGIVPQFEQVRASEGEKGAALFCRDLSFTLVCLLLVLLTLGGWVARQVSGDIAFMTASMASGVIFLSLYALNSAILQCQKKYFLPALAPAFFNVVWIASALMLRGEPLREAMFALSGGIVAAFVCQWLLVALPTFKWMSKEMLFRDWFSPRLFSEKTRQILSPLLLSMAGIGAAQVNSALDAIFTRLADPSGPVYLWYAIRVQQLPLALFGIALSSALLPPLSRAFQEGNSSRFQELLSSGLKRASALILPCSFGLIALAEPGLDLLFGRGDFLASDVGRTVHCLWAYAIGLIPMVYVLLLANSFYARKDYRTPMRASLTSVACNISLNALFVFGFGWKETGIALATSLAALLNCALLWQAPLRVWRLAFCCLGAALLAWGVDHLFTPERAFFSQASRLVVDGLIYGGALLSFCHLFKEKEIISFLRLRS